MSSIEELIKRYPELDVCRHDIYLALDTLIKCFESGKRLYICGNGGSAADALHITGELVKSFTRKRSPDEDFVKRVNCDVALNSTLIDKLQGALPVFALVENTSLATAYANDCDADYIFAQQVYAYVREGDCVIGISTSGNSKNIIYALQTAKGRGAVTLGLTGAGGGIMKDNCDVCICVPEIECYKVQELHVPVYHAICIALEAHFWG